MTATKSLIINGFQQQQGSARMTFGKRHAEVAGNVKILSDVEIAGPGLCVRRNFINSISEPMKLTIYYDKVQIYYAEFFNQEDVVAVELLENEIIIARNQTLFRMYFKINK